MEHKDRSLGHFFVLSVLYISSIGFVASDLYLPSMPTIVRFFSTSKALVQLTFTLYLLSFGLSQLFYGPLSDKIGRKKVILLGLVIALIGSVVCFFANSIYLLIIGRFIEGLGVGAGATIGRTVMRDVYVGDELAKRGSYIAVGSSFFMALSPTLGGYIEQYTDWRYNFLFIIIYTLIAILTIIFFFPETIKKYNPHAIKIKEMGRKYKLLLQSPIFMGYGGCGAFAFAGFVGYLSISPFLFQNVIGIKPVVYGWLALFIGAGLAAGGVANSVLVHHIGRHKLLKFGTCILLFAGILMLVISLFGILNVWGIMIPMLIYMIGSGFVYTNSYAGAFHFFPTMAGFAGAIYGALRILGGVIATAIMAVGHADNQHPLALFLIVTSIFSYFLQEMGYRSSKEKDFD